MREMREVFQREATLVKVVAAEATRIWRMRFSKREMALSETCRKAKAVHSRVSSLCSLQTPSPTNIWSSTGMRALGMMRTSKPQQENRRLGLKAEYTDTIVDGLSHAREHSDGGSWLASCQNSALPRFTSFFISRMRQSRGQQRLLGYPRTP